MKNITSVNTNMPLFIAAEVRSKSRKRSYEGIWLTLPVSKELFYDAIDTLCESWDDVEINYSTTIPDLCTHTLMDTPFAVVNHLAARLASLSDEQIHKLVAIMTSWRHFRTPDEIINYTYTTDRYKFTEGICTYYLLGKSRLAELDMTNLPSTLLSCISEQSFGMEISLMENGEFVPLGYVASKDDWNASEKRRRVPAHLNIRNEHTGEDLYGSWHYMDDSVEIDFDEDSEEE